ncbi:MAG: acyl-CoA dehydrogenase family protein [Clostridia bacterium]|jgi:alkylation response protein AidB-like acyl-CoA dehydrogenase|nr:acyl-CoA dehydrogenase family protein [Spirochaetia bacterium]
MTEYQPFPEFLADFKANLRQLLHVRSDIDQLSTKRGLPPFLLREILSSNPLAAFIPEQYGGRGGFIREGLELASAASYESLPLSLGFGINWALFLQPVAKYGQEEIKQQLFDGFLKDRKMGGLMITEPDFGSDALHMRTSYTEEDGTFHVRGTKHWAGLTGWADYWVLTARRDNGEGNLARDIDFFVCDVSAPAQNIVVEEYYENLGIYMLPYGRNRIDVRIPAIQKLKPEGSGIRMMLDLLHRSRMQFPGMGMGFLARMLDEAVNHCKDRQVGGRSLFGYDQVQQRLSRLQSAYTVCSAMCLNSAGKAGIENDLSGIGLEANSVKTYVTDLMQASAQSLLQLVGAKGYRLDHIAGRSIVDSRPFQIFEGSNDILYIQIAEAIQKQMQQKKETRLLAFLSTHELTSLALADGRFKSLLDFSLALPLSQRRLTELGAIISRVLAVDMVIRLADTGYNKALIESCLMNLNQELSALVGGYNSAVSSDYVDYYEEDSSWFALETLQAR